MPLLACAACVAAISCSEGPGNAQVTGDNSTSAGASGTTSSSSVSSDDTTETSESSTSSATSESSFSTTTTSQDTDPSTFDPSDSLSESTDDMTYPVETFDTTAALPIKKVAAHGVYTLLLDAQGRVFSWGAESAYSGLGPIPHQHPCGDSDENGDPLTFCWPRPVALPELAGATNVERSEYLSCAIFPDGTRTCWGGLVSWYEELDSIALELPTPMPELTGIAGISSAGESRCIWDAQGAVTCWGDTDEGQCGNGIIARSFSPRDKPLAGLPTPQTIGGDHFGYVLLSTDGKLWSWGLNSQFVLGHPESDSVSCDDTVETIRCVPSPKQIANLSSVAQLSVAGPATCIATRSGEAYCWGWNRDGELGQGTCNTPSTHLPQKIPGITDASLIAGNPETTCVVHQAGKKLSCWGKFLAAHISDDEEIKKQCNGYVPYPVDIPLADHIEQITFGEEHVCLIGELEGYKGVMCYGSNRYYELGCPADFIYCPGREKNPVTGEFSARKVVQNLARSFEREENETR